MACLRHFSRPVPCGRAKADATGLASARRLIASAPMSEGLWILTGLYSDMASGDHNAEMGTARLPSPKGSECSPS